MSDVHTGAARAAILAVLHAARQRRYGVSRMKLAKLLYLCDLEAVRSGRKPFTGVTWRWLNYGPFNYALFDVENDLVRDEEIKRTSRPNFFGSVEYRLRPLAPVPEVAPEEQAIIEDVVSRYGKMAAGSLKDETYQTEPMLAAQDAGERGVVLDLLEVRPVPDIKPSLRRLRKVRDRLNQQKTSSEALDEIRHANTELANTRRTATAEMLEG